MNREIEEMAKTLCGQKEHSCAECDSCDLCEFWLEASILYANGYRKSTYVAREIFAKIEKIFVLAKCYGDSGIYYERDVETDIAELRKKYESEGADDE